MILQMGFSFLAGLVTTLSPCVLPVLPLFLGGALQENRKAPLYMAIGLTTSFTVVGFLVSRFGSLMGFSSEEIRMASAIILIGLSFTFLSTKLQNWISEKASVLAAIGSSHSRQLERANSPWGSLGVGALLGVVWSPCAGPTLGVAVTLASQNDQAAESFILMTVYSLGAVMPILAMAYGLRSFFLKNRSAILKWTERLKLAFGSLMLLTGFTILLGLDKMLEAQLISHLPSSWVDLITNY